MENIRHITFSRAVALAQIDKIVIVLAAASVLPLLIHLVPSVSSAPTGAVWLPIFYAPFIAVVFFRPHVGIIAGLLAPSVNAFLTGKPAPEMVMVLTLELTIFVVISNMICRYRKNFWGTSVTAYLAAKFISSVIFGSFFLRSAANAVPGLIVLFLLNMFVIRLRGRKKYD